MLDCIETATRLLKRIKKDKKDDNVRLDEQRKATKKLNYEINNSKKENLPSLFDSYLDTLKSLILESWTAVRNSTTHVKAKPELKSFLPLMIKVYRNAYKLLIEGVKVANSDKVFSVFETHTDILVKGQSEVKFGHKVLISKGFSCIILNHDVFEGNPSYNGLLIPNITRIKTNYTRIPESSSADGGFCRQENLEKCVVVFS